MSDPAVSDGTGRLRTVVAKGGLSQALIVCYMNRVGMGCDCKGGKGDVLDAFL